MSRGISLLFLGLRHTRWGGGSAARPSWSVRALGKEPVPILQQAGWVPGQVWTGGKTRPHRDLILDLPARRSVAIPTELPGPLVFILTHLKYTVRTAHYVQDMKAVT